jgi:hypothetical protein
LVALVALITLVALVALMMRLHVISIVKTRITMFNLTCRTSRLPKSGRPLTGRAAAAIKAWRGS